MSITGGSSEIGHRRNISADSEVVIRKNLKSNLLIHQSAPPYGWSYDNESDASNDSDDDDSDDEETVECVKPASDAASALKLGTAETNRAYKSSNKGRQRHKQQESWIILLNLQLDANPQIPRNHDGMVRKRRKWPMKGWHRRYFILEEGFLKYAKSKSDMNNRGRYQGRVDLGQCCISFREKGRRIHIDCDQISLDHHLKFKKSEVDNFLLWLEQLKQHRLYRQWLINQELSTENIVKVEENSGINDSQITSENLEIKIGDGFGDYEQTSEHAINQQNQINTKSVEYKTRTLTLQRGESLQRQGSINNKTVNWLIDQSNIQQATKELSKAQQLLFDLSNLYNQMKEENQSSPTIQLQSSLNIVSNNAGSSNNNSRRGRHFHLRRKRNSNLTSEVTTDYVSNIAVNSVIQSKSNSSALSKPGVSPMTLSSSNPNLNALSSFSGSGTSSFAVDSLTKQGNRLMVEGASITNNLKTSSALNLDKGGKKLASVDGSVTGSSFLQLSSMVLDTLRMGSRNLIAERERLRNIAEKQAPCGNFNTTLEIQRLKNQLSEAVHQNSEMRSRLQRIHVDSDLISLVPISNNSTLLRSPASEVKGISKMTGSLSRDSISEFFDANEYISGDSDSDSSVEGSDDETEESDAENSNDCDTALTQIENASALESPMITVHTGRRDCLPAQQQDTSNLSLWNLLCRNIGKDLSKIRMPVNLCEPLNSLQRLCEELEYSDLLDMAATAKDPLERLVYVAAFAVSCYASTFYRSSTKPFNPLQGETYECVREDKGWKFMSEQVSHHPPISCSHCTGQKWILSQDIRVKNKFWGKSIECVPVGLVRLYFTEFQEEYQWNKVTMCVHNLFGEQKWLDHYGEVQVKCKTRGDVARITFHKIKQEISGVARTKDGRTKPLFGKWNEAFYSGQGATASLVWRPGAMPENAQLYYGFTRFAVELNEPPNAELKAKLPRTDTRFRPDQRLLEEGFIAEAEAAKMNLEAVQRDRTTEVEPRWFSLNGTVKDNSTFEFTNLYWHVREQPNGFHLLEPPLAELW